MDVSVTSTSVTSITVTGIPTPITEQIASATERLTPAERRVAEVVAADLESAAFATVAAVAKRAKTSGPTVVRMATKLGYSGFSELQAAVQAEIKRQLRPAAERIRERQKGDVVGQTLSADEQNVRSTLEAVDRRGFKRAVGLLADRTRNVLVLSGESTRPAAAVLATGLDELRDGVVLIRGSEVAAARQLARSTMGHVLVAIELRRYEKWVLRMLDLAVGNEMEVIAITDSVLSPLAVAAGTTFVASADGPGPFDSLTGVVALANALVTGVAAKLRTSATLRVDSFERAWAEGDLLADPEGRR